MTYIPYATALPPTLPFKDRRGGLVAMGVILIVLGAIVALFALITAAAIFAPQPPGSPEPSAADLATLLLGYAAVAVYLIWTGAGSIRHRRWVRPIVLIGAWGWLLSGLLILLILVVSADTFKEQFDEAMAASAPPGTPGAPPPGTFTVIATFALGFIVVVFVIVPAVFILFYRGKNVQGTLNYFDPRPSWTDRCPTPVLGVSLGLWLTAVFYLLSLFNPVLPAFGLILTGWPAAAAILALAGACAWLGRSTFRLQTAGWWGTLLLTVYWTASMIWLSAGATNWEAYYRELGMTPEETEAVMKMSVGKGPEGVFVMALVGAMLLGYLLYVRKYFLGPAGMQAPTPPQTPVGAGPLPPPLPPRHTI